MRKTVPEVARRKGPNNTPLVCLTAYTAPMAAALDPHCDVLLVGDSIAMVLYGEPSTLQADMEMMIRHGRAVQNASSNALVVIDMPFGSYQESKEEAFRNAARIIKETGASSVKLEGGAEMANTVAYLSQRAIPVMGHIGLQPQSLNTMGGFKTQGMDDKSAQKIINDAKSIAQAGAYAIVLEGVAESLAAEITKAVPCPVIGIGASAACDGQILVSDDMLGLVTGKKPRFVKNYAGLGAVIDQAVKTYAEDVRSRKFPDAGHVYGAEKPATPQTPVTPPPPNVPITVSEKTLPPLPELKAEEKPAADPTPRATLEGVLRAIPRKSRDY